MFKRFICMVLVITMMSITFYGCGDKKTIDGYTYDTYGFLNSSEKQNPDIEYRVIIGNVVWSIILFETIIAPVYFIGFSIMEPVAKRDINKPKGAVSY